MPPIDPSIIMGLKAPQITTPDPMEQFGKSLALKALIKKDQDEQAVSDAYRQSGGDPNRAMQLLYGAGRGNEALQIAKSLKDQKVADAGIAAQQSTTNKNNFEVAKQKLERIGSLADTVRDQASYNQFIHMGASEGLFDPSKIPPQYDPVEIDKMKALGQTLTQRLTHQREVARDTRTAANQNIAVGPDGQLTENKPAIAARVKIAEAGLPARLAVAQAQLDATTRGQNDQVGPADQKPPPVITVPGRPDLTPPQPRAPMVSPQNFPRANPNTDERVKILLNERSRTTNPSELADLDKELSALGYRNQSPQLGGVASDNISARERAKANASIAGAGTFTPEAIAFTAKQYLSGDRQAVQGFARSATARIALQNAIVEEAARQGMSPEQTAAKIAEFAGTVAGSRTVGQRAANISLAATEAQEMIGIVKETSDKFGRTNFVPFNIALKAYESGTGSPEISAFGASLNALVNVYARAINPTGVPTVSDKEHARAVLNAVQAPAQVDAVLGIIRRELEIAKKAPQTVRESIREGIAGEKGNSSAPVKIKGDDGYNALPKGTRYIGPDGILRIK